MNADHRLQQAQRQINALEIALRKARDDTESLRQLYATWEALTVGLWIIDRDGRVTHGNPAAHRIWNAPEFVDELLGYRGWWVDTGEPLCREDWASYRAVTTGETIINEEVEIEAYDGQRKVILNSAIPMRDRAHHITGAVVINEDITERKRAEQAVRERELDLNRAQAVSHTGSWRLNVQQNVLDWSPETYRMFGIAPGTPLTYERFLAAVHPDDRARVDAAWQAALHGEPYDIEHRILVEDTVKWVRERAELEFDSSGRLCGGIRDRAGHHRGQTRRRGTEGLYPYDKP